jgi:hypothetical protein
VGVSLLPPGVLSSKAPKSRCPPWRLRSDIFLISADLTECASCDGLIDKLCHHSYLLWLLVASLVFGFDHIDPEMEMSDDRMLPMHDRRYNDGATQYHTRQYPTEVLEEIFTTSCLLHRTLLRVVGHYASFAGSSSYGSTSCRSYT